MNFKAGILGFYMKAPFNHKYFRAIIWKNQELSYGGGEGYWPFPGNYKVKHELEN